MPKTIFYHATITWMSIESSFRVFMHLWSRPMRLLKKGQIFCRRICKVYFEWGNVLVHVFFFNIDYLAPKNEWELFMSSWTTWRKEEEERGRAAQCTHEIGLIRYLSCNTPFSRLLPIKDTWEVWDGVYWEHDILLSKAAWRQLQKVRDKWLWGSKIGSYENNTLFCHTTLSYKLMRGQQFFRPPCIRNFLQSTPYKSTRLPQNTIRMV